MDILDPLKRALQYLRTRSESMAADPSTFPDPVRI